MYKEDDKEFLDKIIDLNKSLSPTTQQLETRNNMVEKFNSALKDLNACGLKLTELLYGFDPQNRIFEEKKVIAKSYTGTLYVASSIFPIPGDGKFVVSTKTHTKPENWSFQEIVIRFEPASLTGGSKQ